MGSRQAHISERPYVCGFLLNLSAQSQTDGRKRAVISDLFGPAHIVTTVHRIEEEIGAVACADFDVLDAVGHARHCPNIGDNDTAAARMRSMCALRLNMKALLGVAHIYRMIIRLCRVRNLSALTPKQNGKIAAIVKRQLSVFAIADERS